MKKEYTMIIAFIALTGVAAFSQVVLQGTVKSGSEIIIGASIYIKGTQNGTVSDVDGKFSLTITQPLADSTLVISAIGYKTQQLRVGTRIRFDVSLEEGTEVLSEVVVVGYMVQPRETITGAVNTVKGDDLTKVTVASVDQALQGRAPGVVVTQNTGAPVEGVSVRIRGVSSITAGTGPLYVVDGLPTTDINSLSSQDIASITVLKDAGAAAIYGSRATNGVVIITTKSGTGSVPKVQISSQVGIQDISRTIPMANTSQYVQIYNEAARADNIGKDPLLQRPIISDALKGTLPNINYLDAILRKGIIQTHSISISGGDGKTKYFISGNYFKQEGIIKSSDYDRLTGRVNVESQVNKWLKTGINLNISSATTNVIGSSGDGAGGNGGSVVRYAFFRTPAIPIFDSPGVYSDKPAQFQFFGDGYNPVAMLANNSNKTINNRVFGKFFLEASPIEGLTFTSNAGVDLSYINTRRFDRTYGTSNRINSINTLTIADTRLTTLTFSNYANYTKSFGKNNFVFLLGTEAINIKYYTANASEKDYPDQLASLVYLGKGRGLSTTNESLGASDLLSFFAKVNYDYNNKYLLSATIRRDGSSRFGPDNRWATFYSGTAGWRVDLEDFLKESQKINRLLVRVAYGSVGNQNIGDYSYVDQISSGFNYPLNNTKNVGYAVTTYGNSALKWETSHQINAGVDIELWDSKFSASIDYFRKESIDLLGNLPLASSAGANDAGVARSITLNNGTLLNTGFELTLNYANHIGDFRYSVSANAATLHNEVTSISTPTFGGYVGSTPLTKTEVGYPIGSFYLLEAEGIFQNTTQVFTHAIQGPNVAPGDVKYKDQDGNGVIDGNDRIHAGSPIPKVTSGLNIALGYKNWDLTLFFQGAYGQKIFSVLNRDIEGFYRPFNVTERYFENHWTGEGTSNTFPRASWDASGNNTQYSTRFLEDGSYTRLKNVQLGYNLPKDFISRYAFNAFRIYVSATNLLTFTNYQGLDPEMTVSNNAAGQGDTSSGLDWGTYPAAKSYNVGVNITF